MTAIDLTRLKAAAQAATPGPWTVGYGDGLTGSRVGAVVPLDSGDTPHIPIAAGDEAVSWVTSFEPDDDERAQMQRDADFIAAANPAAVLELIERLEDQAKDIAHYDEQLERAEAEAEHYRKLAGQLRRQQMDAAAPMPDDRLDDVLPLARRDPHGALNLLLRANGQPPYQDPDSEGGHHD